MEDEETPEEATLVTLPREMLAYEECHGVGAEHTDRSDAIRCKGVQQFLSELVSKPAPERHPEAVLRPVHHRGGQVSLKELLQEILPRFAPQAHGRRERARKLRHAVVEERNADLQ